MHLTAFEIHGTLTVLVHLVQLIQLEEVPYGITDGAGCGRWLSDRGAAGGSIGQEVKM